MAARSFGKAGSITMRLLVLPDPGSESERATSRVVVSAFGHSMDARFRREGAPGADRLSARTAVRLQKP